MEFKIEIKSEHVIILSLVVVTLLALITAFNQYTSHALDDTYPEFFDSSKTVDYWREEFTTANSPSPGVFLMYHNDTQIIIEYGDHNGTPKKEVIDY
jgi:hypothetical protein